MSAMPQNVDGESADPLVVTASAPLASDDARGTAPSVDRVIDAYAFLDEGVNQPTRVEHFQRLAKGRIEELGQQYPLAKCLPVLLATLGWDGGDERWLEALPSPSEPFDLTAMRNTLAALGVGSTVVKVRAAEPTHPAVWLRHGKTPLVVISRDMERGTNVLFDPTTNETHTHHRIRGGWLLQLASNAEPGVTADVTAGPENWVLQHLVKLGPLLGSLFTLTLFSNLLALATPLFVMAVYDRAIGTGSPSTLAWLATGAGTALVLDLVLRRYRARVLSYGSARLGIWLSKSLMTKLLDFPLPAIERAGVSAQVARLRDLEKLREILSGPFVLACVDLPFTVIFIGTIWIIGGVVAVVPLVAMALYAVLGWILLRSLKRASATAARGTHAMQRLVLESIEKMRSVQVEGDESTWSLRVAELAHATARASSRVAFVHNVVTTTAQTLTSGAALFTLAVGVYGVLDGTMTAGALIASMILVWKVLAPLSGVFSAVSRIDQLARSARQVNDLMKMSGETAARSRVIGEATGSVRFDRVTFRYGAGDPELSGVSLHVEPGDLVAVAGQNGSGKSTLLRLIAGLHRPQVGAVLLGGRDSRQFDPVTLRQSIAYMTPTPRVFDGTIRENLLLAEPNASDEEIWAALDTANVREGVEALPEQLDTLLSARRPHLLPDSVVTRLAFARVMLRVRAKQRGFSGVPIVLLDEPINGLDYESEFNFIDTLNSLRGKATVFLVTHRPSHLRVANKILLLDRGNVAYFGDSANVDGKIPLRML